MKGWRGLVGAALLLMTGLVVAPPAEAEWLEDAGWGSLTVLTNIVYMPAKLVYSALGGLTGALAFALTGGNLDTAETVWVTAMGGTYVVTPGMLRGEENIAFAGNSSSETADTTAHGSDGELHEQKLDTP
jgi:hypothetical protein